ncbi:IQ domain-containing protein E isoform X2 [Notolabrus celidotus]|uniref:IQ domain-containing protein E isoform X2 n=1 Tax=Notolabrus celidotus TaxID=1203425 RepID=UPI00148F5EAD|nr:IQ domain-containing protein E isoform X2 [Notolabrus celidotus]
MFSTTAKMSQEASDVQTDEDCEELVDESFSFSADIPEKRTGRKRFSGKPPPSPRSPYLSSLNVNQRKVVAAWKLPRSSLGDTRGDTSGESVSARLTSLSNGHDMSQTLRSECDVTPELLKQTLSTRKHKHLNSAFNGFSIHTGDHREKEDMYDEIIRLKKTIHAQKSDNQQLKAKLRRSEEDNTKREKQIEELLDPTKGSEYTRSFVDKRKEGSVVVNGLKQRILKLEQQCREKENALSKLQSELRTTNLEELKITVETYFEEIKRLRVLLEAAEKSRAESKCSQRQQRVFSTRVHRLSEDLNQLQQENSVLKEELDTDSPAGGLKGYREWSKQRLLRRLLEVEKRLEDSKRHTQSPKSSSRLDQEVQAVPVEILRFAMATEAVVSVGMMTENGGEGCDLEERLGQSEKERAELEEKLSSKEDELKELRTEKEELEKEAERWKDEQTKERDKEREQHKEELEQLRARIQTLEERSKAAQVELLSLSATSPEDNGDNKDNKDTQAVSDPVTEKERATECKEERVGDRENAESGADAEKREKEKAASVLQKNWREHRRRDIVMLQSALRGHLLRESQIQVLLKDNQNKAEEASICSDVASSTEGELDAVSLAMIQSAFRGHLARCEFAVESSQLSVPSMTGKDLPTLVPRRARSAHKPSRTGAASPHKDDEKQGEEEEPSNASRKKLTREQTELRCTAESGGAAAADSDDSDDIIVSPSRPMRSREVLLL